MSKKTRKESIIKNNRAMTSFPCHSRVDGNPDVSHTTKCMQLLNNRGMTLVELLVSMGIFAVVMTITVGFFIVMQKMQLIYRDRADLQQEGRIVSEVFARYAREATEVQIVDGNRDGNICSNTDATGYSGHFSDYIALKMKPTDSFVLVFACYQDDVNNPRYLAMGTVDKEFSAIVPANDFGPLPYISSGQVFIRNFQLTHNNPPTHPKTLKYNIEVEEFKNWTYSGGGNIAGEGEKIIFPGYLVMKNEL